MGMQPRFWWQQIKQHRVAIGAVAIVLVIVIALIVISYYNGTGFNGYNQVTTARTISGPSTGTVIRTEVYQPGKSLWDWLQLLFIPAVLTLGAVWITARQNHDLQIAEGQRQAERELTEDKYREDTLQGYIDKMSELLLEKHLRDSSPEDEVRKIARVRTLAALHGLDKVRKRNILLFLDESGLIDKDKRIIDLRDADLSRADLSRANLSEANLSEADLHQADLHQANLSFANLSDANLNAANLRETQLGVATLNDANLSEANLTCAYLNLSDISRVDLSKATLVGAHLNPAGLTDADLRGANLRGADLRGADLRGADLTDVDLADADLSTAESSEAYGRAANLKGATKINIEELEKQAKSLLGATLPDGSKHP